MVFALSFGLICGLLPIQAQAHLGTARLSQIRSQDWGKIIAQEADIEKRIRLFYEQIQSLQLQDNSVSAKSLGPLLKDSFQDIRYLSYKLLNPYDPDSLPIIMASLDDPDLGIQIQAIQKLITVKRNDSAPYLFRFLEKGAPEAEVLVIEALGRYKHPEGLAKLVPIMLRFAKEDLTPRLLTGERNPDRSERMWAYFGALRGYNAEELFPLLEPALTAPELGVKLMAFKVLYYVQTPEVEAPLLAWMRSAPTAHRFMIFNHVLLRHRTGDGFPFPTRNAEILSELLNWAFDKRNIELQKEIWDYLTRSVFTRSLPDYRLIEPYFKKPETFRQILNSLSSDFAAANPQLLPYFYQGLSSTDPQIVLLCLKNLLNVPSPELDAYLVKLLETSQNMGILTSALWALSDSQEHLKRLHQFGQHANPQLRAAVLERFARKKAAQTPPQREFMLKRFREDLDLDVRLLAFEGLCKLQDEKLISDLVLQIAEKDPTHAHKYLASLKSCAAKRPELIYPFLKLGKETQLMAVDILSDWRSPEAAPHFAPLLQQENFELQKRILYLIRHSAPLAEGVKEFVQPLLTTTDLQLQFNALSAWNELRGLSSLERRSAVPKTLLKAKNPDIRAKALSVHTQDHGIAIDLALYTRHLLQETQELPKFAEQLEGLYYAEKPQELYPLLNHAAEPIRDSAVRWLSKFAVHDTLPELQRQMKTFSKEGLSAALEVIGAVGLREHSAIVKPFLQHSVPEVRLSSMLALGLLRDAAVIPLAEKAIQAPFPDSRLAGIRALQALRTPEAVPGLMKALKGYDEESKRDAVLALRDINARAALPEMMRLFSQQALEDMQIGCFGFPHRERAIQALVNLTETKTVEDFMRYIQPDDLFYKMYEAHVPQSTFNQVKVADILAELALPQTLLPFLADKRPLVRLAMAVTLVNYPDPRWIPALQTQLQQETHSRVKFYLRMSLAQLGDQSVANDLLMDLQNPENNQEKYKLTRILLQLKDPQISSTLQRHAWQNPEESDVWFALAREADSQTLQWLKQMAESDQKPLRKIAESALKEAQSLPEQKQPSQSNNNPLFQMDTHFEQRLDQYLRELTQYQKHPATMLQLVHQLIETAHDDIIAKVLKGALRSEDVRLKPIFLPLLLERHIRFSRSSNNQVLAMRALRTLKLSPEDPLLLQLIKNASLNESLELQLFQAQLWHDQHQTPKAISHLKTLLAHPQLQKYPAYKTKALHLLSDISPESERLSYLNPIPALIKNSFTNRDYQYFNDFPEMLTLLRSGAAHLAVHAPKQAQKDYQQALGELYTHYFQGNLLLTPFGAVIHAGLADAALQQGQQDSAEGHLKLALEFWSRYDSTHWGVYRSELFTNNLPIRHSPEWAYEVLSHLLEKNGETQRLKFFQDRFGSLAARSQLR